MDDANADILFMVAYAMTFLALLCWSFAIWSHNIDSRIPFVVLPIHAAIFAVASWLLFDNSFEKVIMLPLMMIVVVWMFKGGFKTATRQRAAQEIKTTETTTPEVPHG